MPRVYICLPWTLSHFKLLSAVVNPSFRGRKFISTIFECILYFANTPWEFLRHVVNKPDEVKAEIAAQELKRDVLWITGKSRRTFDGGEHDFVALYRIFPAVVEFPCLPPRLAQTLSYVPFLTRNLASLLSTLIYVIRDGSLLFFQIHAQEKAYRFMEQTHESTGFY